MTALAPFEADVDPRRVPLDVEIVVPVYNEAAQLAERITALRSFLDHRSPSALSLPSPTTAARTTPTRWRTPWPRPCAAWRPFTCPARAAAARSSAVWSTSDAPVLAYMDVDLSTDLAALLPLVAPLLLGHSDLAIGSRLTRGARVVRGPKRELISRAYNALLHVGAAGRASPTPSAASRRSGPSAAAQAPAARRGPRLVLRHRAARPRRAGRAAHLRGAGRLGRRPRLARRQLVRPRSTTCAASRGSCARPGPGGPPRRATEPRRGFRSQVAALRRRSASSRRSPTSSCSSRCAARSSAPSAQRRRAARHRGREHRREPRLSDLPRRGRARAVLHQLSGAGRLRSRARPDGVVGSRGPMVSRRAARARELIAVLVANLLADRAALRPAARLGLPPERPCRRRPIEVSR